MTSSPAPTSVNRAYLALGFGIVAIAFNGIFVKLANTYPEVAGFYRLGIAALALTIPIILNWQSRKLRLSRTAILLGALAGVAMTADLYMWNSAVLLIGPGMATVLGNTAPLWVVLGAWLIFKEKLHPLYWAGLGVALLGAVLIVGLDAIQGLNTGIGNLLGLGTGLAYATYQMITNRARALLDTLTYMWMYSSVGAIVLLTIALILRHPLAGLPTNTYFALVAMALFSHLGGWALINYAFGHLPISRVTVTLLGQPVVATIASIFIFNIIPTSTQVLGALVTLAGIFLVHISMMRPAPETIAAQADAALD